MPARERDLTAENEALREEIGVLRRELDGARQENEVLSGRIAELEARLGQSSRNSSLPPSSDSPKSRAERRAAAREQQKARAKEERRSRGKQPGAPGANLQMRETPDEVVTHEPQRCASCGEDLSSAPVESFSRRQVLDTPDPVLVCIEHRALKKRCSCGTLCIGDFPKEAKAPACYGPNVRAAALYLLHAQHCSVERTAQALSEMLGAPVSTGFVASLASEAATLLDPFLAEVAERLVVSPVVHVDETPDQVRTDTVWFHVCATELYTFLFASSTRGKAAPDEAGVLGRFTGTMVHDRFQETEICAAVSRATRFSRRERHTLWIPCATCKVSSIANANITGRSRAGASRRADRREEVTRFAADLSVPFTNNEAESSLRMAKLHRKISGCFQGDDSAQHFAAIRSYIGTARKHGIGALDVLARLFRDDVWMPPAIT